VPESLPVTPASGEGELSTSQDASATESLPSRQASDGSQASQAGSDESATTTDTPTDDEPHGA